MSTALTRVDSAQIHPPLMEFSVFLRNQDHLKDAPLHRGTRTVVALVLSAGMARRIGQNAIKLTTPLEWDWKAVKLAARNPLAPVRRSPYIPKKLPPVEVGGCIFKLAAKANPIHLRSVFMPINERVF